MAASLMTPQNGRRLLALCLIFNLVAPSFAWGWPWSHTTTQQTSWDASTSTSTVVTYVNAAGEPCPEPVSLVRYQAPCEPDSVVTVTQEQPCSPPVVTKPRPSPKPSPCSPPIVNKPRPSPKPSSPPPPTPKAPRRPRKPSSPPPPTPKAPRKPRKPLAPPSPCTPAVPKAPRKPLAPKRPANPPPPEPFQPLVESPPPPRRPRSPKKPPTPCTPASPAQPKAPRKPKKPCSPPPPKPLSPKAPRKPRKPSAPYPPPPLTPVGVPGRFPYCECTSGVPNPYITTVSSSSGGKYCWTVTANRPSSGSACGNFDLRKVEVEINPVCKASVQAITFNGQKFFPSFTTYPLPGGPTVLKITRGSDTLTSYVGLRAQSVQMCITLGGACPTLATLCKSPSCTAAFFNPSKSCCPVAALI